MSGSRSPHYLVIGSGLAGYGAVRELRRLAPDASLSVVTRDDGHFYSKPALSTALAKGKEPGGLITMLPEKMAAAHRITLHAKAEVVAIDRGAKTVDIGSESLAYDKLVLATGATPARLVLAGDASDALLSINNLDDYALFRGLLRTGLRVAIIGAGLVGAEFANDLSDAGHPVVVVDPLPLPLGQLVPAAVGAAVRDALAGQGVDWRLGNGALAIDRTRDFYRLDLTDGTTVEADIVISAIGLKPNIALAEAAGLATDRGIVVDNHGRTSDPDIFALGDCAQYPHGVSAFVTPIMAAARAIAATATGVPRRMEFPPLSVQVKTSACPLVLLSPPPGAEGSWVLEESGDDGQKHLFVSPSGTIAGYAMTGLLCTQRAALDRIISDQGELRDVA